MDQEKYEASAERLYPQSPARNLIKVNKASSQVGATGWGMKGLRTAWWRRTWGYWWVTSWM